MQSSFSLMCQFPKNLKILERISNLISGIDFVIYEILNNASILPM